MKPIILDKKHEGMIAEAINEAEGRATVRTITYWSIVFEMKRLEEILNVSKKSLEGVVVDVDENASKFPNAYNYTPESTHYTAVMKGGKWRIYNICRSRCTTLKFHTHLTDEAKLAIIEKMTWIRA